MKRALAIALFGLCAATSSAAAQLDDDSMPEDRSFISPEHFAVEIKVGPYHPKLDAFESYFADDIGPMLALELDVNPLRIPDVLYFGGGGGIGTASFTGKTRDASGGTTSEETSLKLLPLQALGVLRVDALARQLSIPFIFTGKLGYQWAYWSTASGGSDDASGWSVGLLWAGQLALDLDFFEPSAARNMDEEWGINHSMLFFELYGFDPTTRSLPIGDTSWSIGLGFTF